jgi:peptide/nickel transport system substrate-binding protein
VSKDKQNFLARAKKTIKLKPKSNSSNKDMPDFEQLDKQTVQKLKQERWPSWTQLKHVNRYLNKTEKKIVRGSTFIIGIVVVILLISFYWAHTILIPTNGGDYTEGLVGSPNYINPLLSQYNDVDRDITKLVFNGLLKFDDHGVLELDLANALTISPDQKEYTFTIKDNIFWHDDEPMTADDIIFTIISIQDPNWQSPHRLVFANVKVEKLDEYIVKFTITEPLANFLSSLTVGIIPEHLWLAVPSNNVTLVELNKKPIGTGPFKFTSLTKDKNGNIRTMEFSRYDKYHNKPPYLDSISFKFYGDYETGVQALKNDNIEGLNLLPKENRDILEKNKSLIFHNLSLPQYTAIFFNTQKNDLLKDKALRQGLSYAINKQRILDESLHQEGKLIDGPILPGYLGFTDELTEYSFDENKANELLNKTGWVKKEGDQYRTKNDSELSIVLTTVTNPEYENVVEIIKQNWEAIGVKTTLEIISRDRIKSGVIETRNYEALLFGQIIKSDPFPFWHSSQIESPGVNLSVWGHKGIDDLLEQARTITDADQRAEKYIEFQNILTANAPAIFLYNPVHIYPVTKDVKDINTEHISAPADRFNNITNWYIKTQREFSWRR